LPSPDLPLLERIVQQNICLRCLFEKSSGFPCPEPDMRVREELKTLAGTNRISFDICVPLSTLEST